VCEKICTQATFFIKDAKNFGLDIKYYIYTVQPVLAYKTILNVDDVHCITVNTLNICIKLCILIKY